MKEMEKDLQEIKNPQYSLVERNEMMLMEISRISYLQDEKIETVVK